MLDALVGLFSTAAILFLFWCNAGPDRRQPARPGWGGGAVADDPLLYGMELASAMAMACHRPVRLRHSYLACAQGPALPKAPCPLSAGGLFRVKGDDGAARED